MFIKLSPCKTGVGHRNLLKFRSWGVDMAQELPEGAYVVTLYSDDCSANEAPGGDGGQGLAVHQLVEGRLQERFSPYEVDDLGGFTERLVRPEAMAVLKRAGATDVYTPHGVALNGQEWHGLVLFSQRPTSNVRFDDFHRYDGLPKPKEGGGWPEIFQEHGLELHFVDL